MLRSVQENLASRNPGSPEPQGQRLSGSVRPVAGDQVSGAIRRNYFHLEAARPSAGCAVLPGQGSLKVRPLGEQSLSRKAHVGIRLAIDARTDPQSPLLSHTRYSFG